AASETPALVPLTPAVSFAPQGGMAQLTCALDMPAPAPTSVALSVEPSTGFATVPPTVTIAQDQVSATFSLSLSSSAADAGTVYATLGAAMQSATVYAVPPATSHVVISEVGPSGPGGATDEFVELYNPTSQPVDISFWKLQYKSYSGAAYLTAPLF